MKIVRKVCPHHSLSVLGARSTVSADPRSQGWDKTVENYSGFEGYMTEATEPSEPPNERMKQQNTYEADLTTYLKGQGVHRVVIVGLATDFW